MQTVDTILSFYENNFPIRFGVLLFSSKFIKQTENSDDGLTKSEADTSSLVTYFYFILLLVSNLWSMIYNVNNISKFRLINNHNVQLWTI